MFKKLSLILAVMLVFVSTAAFASELTTYANETNGYQIDYPSDWTLLSKDSITEVTDMIANGEIEGLDSATISAYVSQVEQMDMMVALNDDGTNINLIYQDVGMELSSDMLISMLPQMTAQFESIFSDFAATDAGSAVTLGDNSYVTVSGTYSLTGVSMMMSQYYASAGTTLYIFTITTPNPEALDMDAQNALYESILTSFKTPA